LVTLSLACAMNACTPTLDWRDVRPEGSGLQALFPCKPDGHARHLALAGAAVELTLFACTAGGSTYAVAFADLGQPQLVEPALAELMAAAARNIDAKGTPVIVPLHVAGMTPNFRAGQQAFSGRLADGLAIEEEVAVFARGTRVYQATMVGARLEAQAIEMFFGALRLNP
jgi:hypothetical protein